MSSIFPRTNAGGLIVRDPDTGAQIEQPDTFGVDVPEQLNINCDMTALPEDCRARIEPRQVNAIVSELMNFFVAMSPTEVWDCTKLDNLSVAFQQFVQDIAGNISGTLTCSVSESDGMEPLASLIYCDGTTLKKWSISGEDGILAKVHEMLCGATAGTPSGANDRFVYCDDTGTLRTASFLSMQFYLGEWVQARSYSANTLVRRFGKLWSPHAAIPAGTPFTIGDAGQTWYEVAAPGDAYPYDQTRAYFKDTLIVRGNRYYAANADIPANTAFAQGTAGATWREVYLNNRYIYDHNANLTYAVGAVVVKDGMIYRATTAIVPGAWNPAQWERISGERNIYRGPWALAEAYVANDVVEYQGDLYAANDAVAANTAFAEGTTGATWRKVSPSVGIAYDDNSTYLQDTIVSYQGNLFAANGDIPINTPPEGANIGTTGATWRPFSITPILRDFDVNTTYAVGQTVAFQNEINGQKATYRFTDTKIPGPMDTSEIVGERNKYRDHWVQAAAYKQGDLVRNDVSGYAYGTFFEANSDIPANTPWVVGQDPNEWKVFNFSGLFAGIHDVGASYQAGDLVVAPSGVYQANEDIPVGVGLVVGDAGQTWKSYNTGRQTQRYPATTALVRNHQNAYLLFTGAGAMQYTLIAGMLDDGDTVSGASIGGQLSIVAGAGVTIYNKDSLTLIDQPGASFFIRCVGNEEFIVSGDFLPL